MEVYLGIDVGKFSLDVHVTPISQSFAVNNDKAGLKSLVAKIKGYIKEGHTIKLVLCEATGGYEKPLVTTLKACNMPLHVAHANKVRNFAKATGKFAKTDKLDAKILSDYASVLKPKSDDQFISKELQVLKDLQIRKRQLLTDITKERSRLDKNISMDLIKSIKRHITWLKQELKLVQNGIDSFIAGHEDIKAQVDLITSIPGVGQTTASVVLTDMPELHTISDKQAAALAGLAPMNKDSGTKSGKRFITGGRASVRTSLYMATVASIRSNYLITNFYQRLRAKGKPAKVAIVAAMHKLLLIIKSVINRQSKWVETI